MAIKSGDNDKQDDKKLGAKTREQLEAIIDAMIPGQEYKTSEIAAVLGVKDSRARKILALLVDAGLLKAKGANRDRRYIKMESEKL